ncbi:DUF4232 domain-containing protein [Streptomyces flavofungini]|uniref:DUF4232 domain-containing protein n=1 Tax=Streptomyces flavofungini TaxID=68200 RepID=A0ABS0X7J5_9ACTN|nr:DUF4232 domain-containing protein [Streptomyces flavofungini]MBJ3809175.1 DUF4232 domain-containing protein [Streptomyces flavofungini]GHC68940.1 hypothetical protein GCM10010349_43540 [Streptomyces flavofungini]
MKHTRVTALAAMGLAATLSLTACGDNSGKDSSSKGSSSSSSGSSSSSSSSDGSKPEGGSGSDGSEAGNAKSGSGEGTEDRAGTANGETKTDGKVAFCKTADLAIDAADAAPDEATGRIDITMINRGSTTCSATGFAGVDIKDTDNTSNPIERGHAQPRVTTLKPGDAAVFNLSYDIDGSGDGLASPTNLQVTPRPRSLLGVTLRPGPGWSSPATTRRTTPNTV